MYIRSTVSASTNSVMLIEPVPFSSSAFSSSGVNWTYRPFANSYPLIISSFSTFSPSFEQTYCCFRRAPSFLCSQLNEIAADDSPAERSEERRVGKECRSRREARQYYKRVI